MKMDIEKKKAEQGKLQNGKLKEKKVIRKWNGAMFCVEGD